MYWACGIEGDGDERKQKGRSGQISGGGTIESYIGFGCRSAFWRKEKAILGLAVDLRFGGRRRVGDIEDRKLYYVFLLMMAGSFK